MQIIAWHHKHGTDYYDASTDEAQEASAREILRALIEEMQYIYPPDDPMKHIEYSHIDLELAALNDDQVAALPVQSMKDEALKHRKNLEARIRQYESDKLEYDRVLKVIAGEEVFRRWTRKTDSADGRFKAGQRMKAPVTAWSLVRERNGGEYEYFQLETVWVPGEDD